MLQAWMSWSSGKDSALALATLRERPDVKIVGLLTTVNADADRVAMHGVRRELLEAQAEALGLALHVVELPWPCPNEDYERLMEDAIDHGRRLGVEAIGFGDLFLEDIRTYREQSLVGTGIQALFPLWANPTAVTAESILRSGIRAIVTCVDTSQASAELAGRVYDETFLADLPSGVDPCGENGEFHTVVVDGPGFAAPLEVTVGEIVEREGFVFADVIPVARNATI